MLAYRYDCERAAPTCIAAHPGEPILAVGVDHNLLILEVCDKSCEKPTFNFHDQSSSLVLYLGFLTKCQRAMYLNENAH